jgi:Helicase conserved C-terminal domain
VRLGELIERAEALRGEKNDPKLALLRRELEALVVEGFRPVVFCRYIATAHYLAGELAAPLQRKGAHLEVVTGELTPEEREERIERFAAEAEDRVPVLIATDCLSEGVTLQQHFTAVVHYDLVWNPTRHEQREGRVDRFGQAAPVVRALMLYGENNPVDGAVLRVILRKAERIPTTDAVRNALTGLTPQALRVLLLELEELHFFHWPLEFPEVFDPLRPKTERGFDVVLGNPPWERIKLQEQEFFAERHAGIAKAPNKAARGKLIKALLTSSNPVDRSLHAGFQAFKHATDAQAIFVRGSGRWPLTAVGDINTYAIFAE